MTRRLLALTALLSTLAVGGARGERMAGEPRTIDRVPPIARESSNPTEDPQVFPRTPRASTVPSRDMRFEESRRRAETQREMSRDMQQAIERAQREHGGKVLSVDRLSNRGQDTYRVKLLTANGRVRVVQMRQEPESQTATETPQGDK